MNLQVVHELAEIITRNMPSIGIMSSAKRYHAFKEATDRVQRLIEVSEITRTEAVASLSMALEANSDFAKSASFVNLALTKPSNGLVNESDISDIGLHLIKLLRLDPKVFERQIATLLDKNNN